LVKAVSRGPATAEGDQSLAAPSPQRASASLNPMAQTPRRCSYGPSTGAITVADSGRRSSINS
jgi:hypothetical protein